MTIQWETLSEYGYMIQLKCDGCSRVDRRHVGSMGFPSQSRILSKFDGWRFDKDRVLCPECDELEGKED